jgi:hypothetical protein
MSNFDESRRADLRLIDEKLHDNSTTRRGMRYLERSRSAILQQRNNSFVRNLRSRLLRATQVGDGATVNRIQEQLHDYDRRAGFDQH